MRTGTTLALASGAVALFLVPSSAARADAIGIPADVQCPAGTALSANHAGHWCEVQRSCTSDGGCYDGEICSPSPIAVCAGTETYTMGGRLATDHPSTHSIRVGRGPCDASCTAPAACDTSRRCVPRPAEAPRPAATSVEAPTTTAASGALPSTSAPSSSSSCRAAPSVGTTEASVVALLGATIGLVRFRRRGRA